MEAVKWHGNSVSILDQRRLPMEERYIKCENHEQVVDAIRDMAIRGAPAIAIAAGMGMALAAKHLRDFDFAKFKDEMKKVADSLRNARPTAVNIFHAVKRLEQIIDRSSDSASASDAVERDALSILAEDIAANHAIGKNGSGFIKDGYRVMTHCNAGELATGGHGTALGVIRTAVSDGKKIEVFACETRPLLQGARLTAWELHREGIQVTLLTDLMAGHFMKQGLVDCVMVGADRIAANGDTANKIGTYSLSVLAKAHNIPFYVAAPISTIDIDTISGDSIVIEERSVDEVAFVGIQQVAPEGITIRNPSFDVTPADNITAIITEKGVIEGPDEAKIRRLAL
jgi:methylthioribose-1-phosphate isomerase